MSTSERKRLRCAVYTRKSTEEGLDQEFNSLDAQREACVAFIASQAGLGWRLVEDRYDDGGISGGTMERPALQRLLNGIREGRVDVVVVYKIDRLTRSLMDFAKIVEIFDANSVSFVSVTQQFNTTTSMGRLTLNVLLSFAQFEREVTAERIRDKIAASRKKGIWMGGTVPMGYRSVDKKLVVHEQEAAEVRQVFKRYLELGSVFALVDELNAAASAVTSSGDSADVAPSTKRYSRGKVYHMLSNPVYLGKAKHRHQLYEGEHKAVVDADLFDQVQQMLRGQAPGQQSPTRFRGLHLLMGNLFDETGDRLSPAFTINHQGRRYRYYISNRLKVGRRKDPNGWRVPAEQLEAIVQNHLTEILTDKAQLSEWVGGVDANLDLASCLAEAEQFKNQFASKSIYERSGLLAQIFPRITLTPTAINLEENAAGLVSAVMGTVKPTAAQLDASPRIKISLPLLVKRRGNEARIVIEGKSDPSFVPDSSLINLVSKAQAYLSNLTDGSGIGLAELAAKTGTHIADVSRVLPLAFLAPSIVNAFHAGRQPPHLTARYLSRLNELPVEWHLQRAVLGF